MTVPEPRTAIAIAVPPLYEVRMLDQYRLVMAPSLFLPAAAAAAVIRISGEEVTAELRAEVPKSSRDDDGARFDGGGGGGAHNCLIPRR